MSIGAIDSFGSTTQANTNFNTGILQLLMSLLSNQNALSSQNTANIFGTADYNNLLGSSSNSGVNSIFNSATIPTNSSTIDSLTLNSRPTADEEKMLASGYASYVKTALDTKIPSMKAKK
ncbi:MAG: hypothetical protein WCG23_06180 [bacterium]